MLRGVKVYSVHNEWLLFAFLVCNSSAMWLIRENPRQRDGTVILFLKNIILRKRKKWKVFIHGWGLGKISKIWI